MNPFASLFLLTLGGATGSALRGWLSERFGGLLPWTTLFINITGSFAAGWIRAHFEHLPDQAWVLTFLVTGMCGGYTTFSTLALQAVVMWRERRTGRLAGYLALTLGLGLAAAWAGLVVGGR